MPQLYYTSLASIEAIGDPFLEQGHGKTVVYPTFYIPHPCDLAAGGFKAEGEGYMSYAARREVEGTALVILTGASTGVSEAMVEDLEDIYQYPERPSHR